MSDDERRLKLADEYQRLVVEYTEEERQEILNFGTL